MKFPNTKAAVTSFALKMASVLLFFGSCAAKATTVFQEDFSGATPGTYSGAIPGTNFTVTGGNIDIVGVLNGSFFTCVANPTGNCLDLIGNVGSGQITSTTGINLIAGHTYTISYTSILQGFPTGSSTPTSNYSVGLGSSVFSETSTPTVTPVSISFLEATTQLDALLIFTSITNIDNVHGPVLSDITVTDTGAAVPLPAALPLFVGGLGVLGVLGWRRKRKAAAAA